MGNSSWTDFRLGDVCQKIGSGATPRGGKDVYLAAGEVALIRSQNVYNNRFEKDGLTFLSVGFIKLSEQVERALVNIFNRLGYTLESWEFPDHADFIAEIVCHYPFLHGRTH